MPIDHLLQNWLTVAWIAPVLWAASSVIDVLLVASRRYASANDASIITGLFGLLPATVVVLASGQPIAVDPAAAALGIAAGVAFFIHTLCYFRVLFLVNDAAYAESFLNCGVLCVPVLAFVLLGEQLAGGHYVGILTAFAGVAFLIAPRHRTAGVDARGNCLLAVAVLSLSFSLVLQAELYERVGFASGVLWFSVGLVGAASVLWCVAPRTRVVSTVRRFALIFIITETAAGCALLATQRATDLSPAVSLVVLIESTAPIFIMVLSGGLLALWRGATPCSRVALLRQIEIAPRKITALAFILAGVALAQSTALPYG